jgi:hypothetical protein
MIEHPCRSCAKHKRCAEEKFQARRSLFAHGRGEPAPTCHMYREATWRGLDVPMTRAARWASPVFGQSIPPRPLMEEIIKR